MSDEQNFFDHPVKNDLKITFERLQLVTEMITQLVVY